MKDRWRILVLDEEDAVRRSCAASLGSRYETRTATSAGEALREMQRAPADLVLLGLPSDGVDALEVLKALKKGWPQSEVVVMSRFPSIESAKDAVRNGAFDYLAKPVGPDQMTGAARRALLLKQWALRESFN